MPGFPSSPSHGPALPPGFGPGGNGGNSGGGGSCPVAALPQNNGSLSTGGGCDECCNDDPAAMAWNASGHGGTYDPCDPDRPDDCGTGYVRVTLSGHVQGEAPLSTTFSVPLDSVPDKARIYRAHIQYGAFWNPQCTASGLSVSDNHGGSTNLNWDWNEDGIRALNAANGFNSSVRVTAQIGVTLTVCAPPRTVNFGPTAIELWYSCGD